MRTGEIELVVLSPLEPQVAQNAAILPERR